MKNKKYVTVDSKGLGLHAIANVMTNEGNKMNHSTVRNIINKSFIKIAKNMTSKFDLNYSEEQIFNIAKSPDFQESVVELLERKQNEK
tara:strand:- start:245 stop:508 length:264 start_codon:yes stop_codon:yes gene_type:complete